VEPSFRKIESDVLKIIAQAEKDQRDKMNDLIIATIRTVVPSLVGTFVLFMSQNGIGLDEAAISGLVAFLVALFTGVYYLGVRLLSKRFPQAEVLLGFNKKPEYVEPKREV
jgi:hypothetical protein